MVPERWRIMCGAAWRAKRKDERRLAETSESKSSAVVSVMGL